MYLEQKPVTPLAENRPLRYLMPDRPSNVVLVHYHVVS